VGEPAVSERHDGDRFRFVFMADCQLGCYASFSGMGPAEIERFAARDMRVVAAPKTEGFDWDARRYERAIAAAVELRPEFVVMGGDMVDDPTSAGQRAAVFRITAGLGDIPMNWVPGNHDVAEDTVVPTPESLRRYRASFGPDHYAFDHRGTTFVVTDTVVWQHPERVGAEWEDQLAALEAALRSARTAGTRQIVIFGHHPLFTAEPEEPDSYWNIPGERRRWILGLLRAHHVRAFLCGHWHRNGGGWDGDLEVVVTGPVGYPLGADPSGFRIVEMDGGSLRHRYVALPVDADELVGERR
jgi:3',5'-cyclic AMP phosphodiesterase CpdA